MAKVGLSKSYAAEYTFNAVSGEVTYANGMLIGKAVSADIAVNAAGQVVFYADNGPAESAASFGGGTLTIVNDDFTLDVISLLFDITVTSSTSPNGDVVDFPADLNAPYLGYGTVFKHQKNGTPKWRAVFLHKVQFNTPAVSGSTQGETIAFEGNQLTANIMRSDASSALWVSWADFATEANAEAWIKAKLNISDPVTT